MSKKVSLFSLDDEWSKHAFQLLDVNLLTPEVINVDEKDKGQALESLGRLGSPAFANSFKEPDFPAVLVESGVRGEPRLTYISLSGIQSYIRQEILKEIGNRHITRKDLPYFPEKRNVVCYGEGGKEHFRGPISKAPYNLEKCLSKHDFSSWHEVTGSNIGWLGDMEEEISQSNGKPFLDLLDGVVLFKDDIKRLKAGEQVVTLDSRSIYHVNYEALFLNEGDLIKLHASMMD
ncbi:MAG TPA: hypothetical protein VJH92_06030 [Candidatus Nanoarchaeia archaeon]|nr:hypothetical protein [Candidatus Nanoarchaeia archaeon]